ncbi:MULTISPECIES: hypothetical protein [unclassified Rathayibacter]|uniref:hypothetical protein n=1 Tax=unclassified Rathayibacter TaxID=2609250 RepID=UPI0011B029C8|nr:MULTISPECIES: hypothetical protein [unclassified Rathayibacter]
MAAEEWFSNEESPVMSVFLGAFVARLRLRAAEWDTDVRPADTTFDASLDEVWCGIQVPGLSGDFTALWLECAEDDHGMPKLEGSWGIRDLVADDYGSDPIRDLTVRGAPITPETLADLAAQWCERHLRMDISREEWKHRRWTRHDDFGRVPHARRRGIPLRTVLERSNGHATGLHLKTHKPA